MVQALMAKPAPKTASTASSSSPPGLESPQPKALASSAQNPGVSLDQVQCWTCKIKSSADDGASHPIRDVNGTVGTCDGRRRADGRFSSENAPSASGTLSEAAGRSIHAGDLAWNPFTINAKVKPGIGLMVAQAWNQHCSDHRKVSTSAKEVFEVMVRDYENEFDGFLDEAFLHAIDLTACDEKPFVSEVYTTSQRVLKEASKRGHKIGSALSLDTGCDFLNPAHRQKAIDKLKEEKPEFLVVAFTSGPFSPLQRLRPSSTLKQRQEDGRVLMDFGLQLCRIQREGGRHYVLGNPRGSSAWHEPSMMKFLEEEPDVCLVKFDQCRYKLKSLDGSGLHKNPTTVASSSPEVISELHGKVCMRDHTHVPVMGGSKYTSHAGLYSPQLARAMLRGMEKQFEKDHARVQEALALDSGAANGDVVEEDPSGLFADEVGSEGSDVEESEFSGYKVPAQLEQTIRRLHENTGHRSNRRLARAVALAGAPPEAVVAAKRHRCSAWSTRARR